MSKGGFDIYFVDSFEEYNKIKNNRQKNKKRRKLNFLL